LIVVDMPNGFPFVGSFPYFKGTSYYYWPPKSNVGPMPNASLVHIFPMAPLACGSGNYILGPIGKAMLDKVWQTPMEHQMDHEVNPLEVDHQLGPHEEVHKVGHLMNF
jgi:hypothetical protein